MNSGRDNEPPAGISVGDIYFVVFRHKWKIIVLSVAGLVAAAVFDLTQQPPYQSRADLIIRYVADQRALNPSENNARVTSVIDIGQTIMNSETHILASFDVFAQVATNIGPDKILAKLGGGNDPIHAASVIAGNLKVEPDGSDILLTFHHPDPDVVRTVLGAIIDAYMDKHDKVHEASELSDDQLDGQIAQLRMQIAQTEQDLMVAKTNAGIIDIDDAKKYYSEETARIKRELLLAQADHAVHEAGLVQLPSSQTTSTNLAPDSEVPPHQLDKYKALCARLDFLQKQVNDYLAVEGYTEENKLVKEKRDQIAEAEKAKNGLETSYPTLAAMDLVPADSATQPASDSGEAAQLVSLPTRIKTLQDQLGQIQTEVAKLDEVEAKIADLEQRKQVLEGNYKYFTSSREQARIDEELGHGQDSSIKVVQTPSPAYRDFAKFHKSLFLMIFGGVFAGLAWALLTEFYLDRSIKRPVEIQTKLKMPLFLSIPDLGRNRHSRLALSNRLQLEYKNHGRPATAGSGNAASATNGKLEIVEGEINRRLNSYYDALRDRLVIYFESINLTRKPKLVAVTGVHSGSGVSTIAAGLASSLSETGDGRVLLVDMNVEHGAAQQFFGGKPGCKLDDALESEKRHNALVQENLYVVNEGSNVDKLPRALPKRFASLVPKLKASDYDYIIFDMPPVSPTSITLRLAGFMDTVMLVIEAEKTSQQIVQQANTLLAESKANVTAVLNKTRNYVPARLHQDSLSDV